MGGCMGQWVGSGQMTNLIKLKLINIIWFCLKIYNFLRDPYLWVGGWVNGWAHVKPLKSNKSWPDRDNSIMDILDILLDILLKPPQPLYRAIFLFFRLQFKFWSGRFQMHIQVLEYSPFWSFVDYSKFVWEVSFTVLKDTLLFKCSEFLSFWSFWSGLDQIHIQMIESGIFQNRDQTVYA